MSEVLKANIFFFITGIAVVALAVIFGVILVYLIRIMRDVKDISKVAREQAHLLAGDMDDIRKKVRSAEWRWSDTISSLAGLWNRINGSKRKGRSKK